MGILYIMAIPFESDRKISAKTCGLDDLFPTDGLSSDPET